MYLFMLMSCASFERNTLDKLILICHFYCQCRIPKKNHLFDFERTVILMHHKVFFVAMQSEQVQKFEKFCGIGITLFHETTETQ